MSVNEYYEDIFSAPVQTLVNPINIVGVMGAGLALEFKKRVPGLYDEYRKLCKTGQLTVDKLWRYKWPGSDQQVICFPTKQHYHDCSYKDQVLTNLVRLVSLQERLGIRSLAIPPVGCGLGGLNYERDMREDMIGILSLMNCEVRIVLGVKKERT